MFEPFTDAARKAMSYGRQHVQRLHSDVIDTEHILLGIAQVASCGAAKALAGLNLDHSKLLDQVERLVPANKPLADPPSPVPLSARSKDLITKAGEHAKAMCREKIDTSHLLLGLLDLPEGWGAKVLAALGTPVDRLREELLNSRVTFPTLSGTRGGPYLPISPRMYAASASYSAPGEV